jgi:23S rRNA pseudouridine2605 synthase
VECADRLPDEAIARLREGVELNDGPTKPARVRRLQGSHLEITIAEGRNRQVRRMIEAVESNVVALTRTAIGPIVIGALPPGTWRELTLNEVSF